MGRNLAKPAAQLTVSVAPTLTVLETFNCKNIEVARFWFENTDVSQTLTIGYQTRPVAGTGTWGSTGVTWIDPIAASTLYGPLELKADGNGEMRIWGTASGAGLTCKYTRATEALVWPQS